MFVKILMSTTYVGMDSEVVYEAPDDISEETLNDCAHDLARDNAESYGILDGVEDEEEYFSGSWEVLENMTREEIENEYGSISKL